MQQTERVNNNVNHKFDFHWFIFSASFHHPEVFRWVLHRSCPSIHLDSQQGLAPTWVPLQVLPCSQPPPLPELEESHREDGTGWLPASTQTAVDRLRQALLTRLLGSGPRARTGWEVKAYFYSQRNETWGWRVLFLFAQFGQTSFFHWFAANIRWFVDKKVVQ